MMVLLPTLESRNRQTGPTSELRIPETTGSFVSARSSEFGPDESKLLQQHGLALAPLVKPVIFHAGSVPLQATVSAPLKTALSVRTFHAHAATCKMATEWPWYLANT